MITGVRRVVKSGFVGFWRSAYVSLASVFVLTVALFVIGSTMFIDKLLSTSLESLQSKVDINVYFVPDAPQPEIDRITAAVKALPDVAAVKFTSREDALAQYRERNKNDEVAIQALEELNDNPLGANLAIQANETSQYEKIATFLQEQKDQEQPNTPVIDEINYARNKDSINKFCRHDGTPYCCNPHHLQYYPSCYLHCTRRNRHHATCGRKQHVHSWSIYAPGNYVRLYFWCTYVDYFLPNHGLAWSTYRNIL
jgi:hypothetical protein